MSIWNYMNDIERQTLREANQEVADAKVALVQIDAAKIDAENRLGIAKSNERNYQSQAVNRAISGNAEPAPEPEVCIEDLEFLIVGLSDRQEGQGHTIKTCEARFESKAKQTLGHCIERASEVYRERADELVETWHELNAAQFALGERDLEWMHMRIPGMEGMRGCLASHSRPTLFAGEDVPIVDGAVVTAELQTLFG